MENDEIKTRELFRFIETDVRKDKVIGDFRKMNDLLNVSKLKNAGLIEIYQEKYV